MQPKVNTGLILPGGLCKGQIWDFKSSTPLPPLPGAVTGPSGGSCWGSVLCREFYSLFSFPVAFICSSSPEQCSCAMPAHSWAPRPGTEVSQLRACHLPSQQRRLNPSFLPVYLMVLSRHKAALYLLHYRISARKMTVAAPGDSRTPLSPCPQRDRAAVSVLGCPNSCSRHGQPKAHVPSEAGRAGAAATDVPMVTGAALPGVRDRDPCHGAG